MCARILVIEDNLANLQLFAYVLEAAGHTTIAARDGEAGLRAARDERPDLILCDLVMPGMDGREVARRLKQDPELRSIPLVAATAQAMIGDKKAVLAAGFDGYIAKPIDVASLVIQLERFLAPAPPGPP